MSAHTTCPVQLIAPGVYLETRVGGWFGPEAFYVRVERAECDPRIARACRRFVAPSAAWVFVYDFERAETIARALGRLEQVVADDLADPWPDL